MSCWDCLRLFFPSSYQFTQPTYELEEIVIVNNNNTTEKTYLKSENYLNLKHIKNIYEDDNLEDEDEIIYERKSPIIPTPKEIKNTTYLLGNLSDTEIYGNQKLKKRRKRHRMIKETKLPLTNKGKLEKHKSYESSESSESSWDDSLILS